MLYFEIEAWGSIIKFLEFCGTGAELISVGIGEIFTNAGLGQN